MQRQGNSSGNFRQELRRAFLVYALIPAVVLSLLVYLVLFLSWYTSMVGQTRGSNLALSTELDLILQTYRNRLSTLAEDQRLFAVLMGQPASVALYEDLYALSRSASVHCAFYVLDADLNILMSNTSVKPWYAGRPEMKGLGILKAAGAQPGRVVTEINKQLSDEALRPPLSLALSLQSGDTLVGYLCVDLLYSEVLMLMSAYPSVDIVLVDRFSNIAAASLPKFSDRFGKLLPVLQRNDRLFSRRPDHRFILGNTMDDFGLSVLTITHTGVADTVIAWSGFFLVALFALLSAILNVSARKIATRKTLPIDMIVQGLREVQGGNLDTVLAIDRPEEFHIIGDAFNQMLTDIKRLMAINAEEIRRTSRAEISQLEAQFKPHFLFNTLETIRYMIALDPQKAGQTILSLSALLRYSISTDKGMVRLSEDLGYTSNYLMIQKNRFSSRFFYEISVDGAAGDCIVPRLIIQPLIENAVHHGFDRKETLTIHICAGVADGRLLITIHDNGQGMTQEKLSEIRLLLESESNDSDHIGLYNVHRRIQLMYGPAYGVSLESLPDQGTKCILTLPSNTAKEQE